MSFMFAFENIVAIISAIILLVVVVIVVGSRNNSVVCYASKCKEGTL